MPSLKNHDSWGALVAYRGLGADHKMQCTQFAFGQGLLLNPLSHFLPPLYCWLSIKGITCPPVYCRSNWKRAVLLVVKLYPVILQSFIIISLLLERKQHPFRIKTDYVSIEMFEIINGKYINRTTTFTSTAT